MSAIACDSQSLIIDGRRVWLVAVTFDYTRIPRLRWRSSLHRLRTQGVNTIAVTIPWRVHEPKPGRTDFTGPRDVSHLLSLTGEMGLHAIVRPGPYAGDAFEAGGLPDWVCALPGVKVREGNRVFLDACARWMSAVMEQVAGHQVTRERKVDQPRPGPVLLVQVEHDWRCHHEEQATAYLGELTRHLREAGCTVPLIEANNGWQPVEATFSVWRGGEDLASTMRQFRAVQQMPPAQQFPLLACGVEMKDESDAIAVAQALAVGSQVEMTLPSDAKANGPALELPPTARRIALFCRHFSPLLAGLPADRAAIALSPSSAAGVSVMHQHGTHGDLVMLLRNDKEKSKRVDLLLPDGLPLSIDMGDERAAWAVINVNLAGVATLDHTNLRPLAFLADRLLVLYGPAGGTGVVSIDGAPIEIAVPRQGAAPTLVPLETITIAVLNAHQASASRVMDEHLFVGAGDIDEQGRPTLQRGFKQVLCISSDGVMKKTPVKTNDRSSPAPKTGPWTTATAQTLIDGDDAAWHEMSPGGGIGAISPGDSHVFQRIRFNGAKPGGSLLAPQWNGRIALFQRGRRVALLPAKGATFHQPFTLKAGTELTMLVSCDAPPRDGWRLGEARGLAGDLHQVKAVKLPAAKRVRVRQPDATPWRAFLPDVSYHVHPTVTAWTWSIKTTGRHALILTLDGLPMRALLRVDGKVVGGCDPIESQGRAVIVLRHGEQIEGTRHQIELIPMEGDETIKGDPRRFIRCFDAVATLTAKASHQYASVTPPKDDAFSTVKKARTPGAPAWHRTQFRMNDATRPLYVTITGVEHGQAWINGHALGDIDATRPMHLPAVWLITAGGGANVLTIFSPDGVPPRGCTMQWG